MKNFSFIILSISVFLIASLSAAFFTGKKKENKRSENPYLIEVRQPVSAARPRVVSKVKEQKSLPIQKAESNLEECFTDCKKYLFDSLLSGDVMTFDEVNYVSNNIDEFVHFLRFHPEVIEQIGVHFATVDVGDEDTSGYDENMDKNLALLNEVITHLPVNDLKQTTHLMLSSQEKTTKRAGLVFVGKMFQKMDDILEEAQAGNATQLDAEVVEKTAAISSLVNNFLHTESDPRVQIEAIQMLADYNPDMISEQIVGLLSGISTNESDINIRGQAMELAAVSAKPDSLVLTQIEDELGHPSSPELQEASLRALDVSLRRSYKNDKVMRKRLAEFEIHLQQLASNAEVKPEMADYAAGLLKAYYEE